MKKFWGPLIQNIEPYVPGEQPQDQQYIKLNTNENPYLPPKSVFEDLDEVWGKINLYPDPDAKKLCKAVSNFYNGVKESNVFIGNGSDEVLAIAFQAFFSGSELVYPDLTYSFYPVYAQLYNVDVQTIPLSDDFTININQYQGINKGIIIANPNAPTTCALSLTEIETIVTSNPNHVIVIDEAYVDFGAETAVYLTQKYENLLVIQTFSKSRSMAGLRIGFAIGSDTLIAAMNAVKNSFNSYTVDMVANELGARMMKNKEWFTETVNKIIATRERVTNQLINMGFDVLPSKTNFLFVKHEKVKGEAIYKQLKEAGVLVRYFSKPARIANYIRISVGTDEEMNVFIDKLTNIID